MEIMINTEGSIPNCRLTKSVPFCNMIFWKKVVTPVISKKWHSILFRVLA